MSVKVFNISVPEELLAIIDQQVRLSFTNRNEYVKAAILTRLKTEGALGGCADGPYANARRAQEEAPTGVS